MLRTTLMLSPVETGSYPSKRHTTWWAFAPESDKNNDRIYFVTIMISIKIIYLYSQAVIHFVIRSTVSAVESNLPKPRRVLKGYDYAGHGIRAKNHSLSKISPVRKRTYFLYTLYVFLVFFLQMIRPSYRPKTWARSNNGFARPSTKKTVFCPT